MSGPVKLPAIYPTMPIPSEFAKISRQRCTGFIMNAVRVGNLMLKCGVTMSPHQEIILYTGFRLDGSGGNVTSTWA